VKLKLFLLVGVITGCIFLPSCRKKDGVKIKVNLPEGFSAVVRKTHAREAVITFGGRQLKRSQKIEDEYLIECVDVDSSGVMTVKQTYQNCKVSGYEPQANGEGANFYEYDMSKPSGKIPGLIRLHAAGLGQSLIIRVGPDGETINISGVEAFADKLMGEMAGLVETRRDGVRKKFIESLKANRVAGLLREYPRRAKFVGQSWKTKLDMSRPLSLGKTVGKGRNKFKLESISDGVARLKKESEFELTITWDQSGLSEAGAEGKKTLKLSGYGGGEMNVDLATGLVLSSRGISKSRPDEYGGVKLKGGFGGPQVSYTTVRTVETIIH